MNELTRETDNRPKWGLLGDDFDNIFEGLLRPRNVFGTVENGTLVPAVDVVDEENQFVVSAELPGIDQKDIEVTVNDGVLTINAERKADSEEKDDKGTVIRRDSRYGKYVRSMRLGNAVDAEKVKASYKDGILKLTVPKTETVKPKKIAVNAA